MRAGFPYALERKLERKEKPGSLRTRLRIPANRSLSRFGVFPFHLRDEALHE